VSRADDLALERALGMALAGDAGAAVVLERTPSAYRSTFPVEELRVALPGGERRVVWKDTSRRGADDPAWRPKPPFLHDPCREIVAYRAVLEPGRAPAPALLGWSVERRIGRYWLFLEHVAGEPLWQIGELALGQRTAEELARLHARYASRVHALPRSLLVRGATHYRRWLDRALRFAGDTSSDAAARQPARRLAARAESAFTWLSKQKSTFLHGEPYPANVLVEGGADSARSRIVLVDWEMAGIGTGLLDLAALVAGGWSETDRDALLAAYREALPGSRRPRVAEVREGVHHCQVLLALQWLGWSRSWRPPPEHDHDWLATALAHPASPEAQRGDPNPTEVLP
jgi:aminoglycoside phosphotransferase (APT) family kinase protein